MKKTRLVSLILVLSLAATLLTSFAGMADETEPPAVAEETGVTTREAEAAPEPEPSAGEPEPAKEDPQPAEDPEPAAKPEPEEDPEPEEAPEPAEEPQPAEGEDPQPAEGEQPPAAGEDPQPAEEPEPAEEGPKPAEEPAEEPADEEPAPFSEGYALVRKGAKAYADEAGQTPRGSFTEDAAVWAEAGPAGSLLKIVFDTAELREKNEPPETAYLPASGAEPLSEEETARLEAELENDPDAREYGGRKIGLASFAFAGPEEEPEEEPGEGPGDGAEEGKIAENGAATTVFLAPSGTVKLGVGETVKILVKADNASGDVAYSWERSADGGRSWTGTGSDTDLQTVSVTEQNYQSAYGQSFRCAVTDDRGTVRSASVKVAAPFTVSAPSSVKAGIGRKIKITAKPSTGDKKAKYRWQYSADGGKTWKDCSYKGSRHKTMTVSVSMKSFFYRFRCLVTVGNHSMYSNTVTLRSPYRITVSPAKKEAAAGKSVKFKVKVKGAKGKVTFKWQKSTDGGKTWKTTKSKGYKTKKITVKASASYNVQYRCVIKAHKGKAISPVVWIDPPGASKFDFQPQGDAAWKVARYTGTKASVTVPDSYSGKPVTAVGDGAFKGSTTLKTVKIPKTITTIGANAFDGCMALATVTLTDSVTSIGREAFRNCPSLMDISISE